MKPFTNKTFSLTMLFLSTAIALFAGEHKNNFRLEKRHYRKGFYFDCWVHPKTYPRTFTTPETIDRQEPVQPTGAADRVEPVQNISIVKDTAANVEGTSKTSTAPENITPQKVKVNTETNINVSPVDNQFDIDNGSVVPNDEDTNKNPQVDSKKSSAPVKVKTIATSKVAPVSAPVKVNKSKVPQAVAPNSNPQSTSAPVINQTPIDILVPVPNN